MWKLTFSLLSSNKIRLIIALELLLNFGKLTLSLSNLNNTIQKNSSKFNNNTNTSSETLNETNTLYSTILSSSATSSNIITTTMTKVEVTTQTQAQFSTETTLSPTATITSQIKLISNKRKSQQNQYTNRKKNLKISGKYYPEIYNRYSGDNGKYRPDPRGKYVHQDVPYNGGYGDRGSVGGFYIHNNNEYNYYHVGSSSSDLDSENETADEAYLEYPDESNESSDFFNNNYFNNSLIKYEGWRIIRYNHTHNPTYHYLYETENKILAEEHYIKNNNDNKNKNESKVKAFGFFEYFGNDGKKYRVNYTADEFGFWPKGNHIHKSIQKALEYQLNMTKKS